MIRNALRRLFARNVRTETLDAPTPGTTLADMDPRVAAWLSDTTYGDWRTQPLA